MKKVIDLTKLYDASKNKRQWEAHQSPERYILYGGAYGGGKTAWLINEGIALSIDFPGNRGFLCCKFLTDFRDNALKQLEKFLPSELIADHHKTERYFRLINGSLIMYGGLGNDTEAIKTISNMPELGWFGVDQAEQITERQFLLLDGRLRLMLPGIKYKGLLTANPEPGWLRDRFIERVLLDHRFIPASAKDNPFLPAEYEEKLRNQYPEAMAQRLLDGDWDVEVEGNYLIPYSQIREAVGRDIKPEGNLIAGVDVSRYGDDETVFILRKGNTTLDIVSWSHQDTIYSVGRIAHLIRDHKPVITNIDSIGLGAGIFDTLKHEGFAVKEVNVGEAALEKESYANKRAEYAALLAKRFREGTISIPDHSKLQSQLAAIKYTYDTKGRLLIESKEDMRKRGMSSPDYVDALMLAFIDSAPQWNVRKIEGLHFSRRRW